MMRKLLKRCIACLALLCVMNTVQAAVYPKYPVQKLTDGQTYVLVNLANPIGYMCRTTWDNALVMQGRTEFDSQYGVKLTAHYNAENNLWCFSTSQEEHPAVEADPDNGVEASEAYTSYTYLGIPSGTNNVRALQTFEEVPYFEVTEGVTEGFYKLRIAEGHQHTLSIGVLLHLNGGGTYPVANEPTNSWYPDFYGGVKADEYGDQEVIYDEETGMEYKVMADSTSCNWGFVAVEDIDAYNEMGNSWKVVTDFGKGNYCNEESDYQAGFQLSYAEAERLMQEGNLDGARAVIDAKMALYAALNAAATLQEETSDLDAIVESAREVFGKQVDAETVSEAAERLKKACSDYEMGLGFITGMGQNMSFEDLSSQGGNATSGVAGAPTGWNVYINGKQAVTASEVSAGGVTAWHGINADCAGYKDGNNGFGLWTNSVPEYELSQTITGLENGTYTITCGLMVGANGNGSRRTTQRVFGNYNSTLFAGEDEYADGILPGELKEFANLYEPTTDTDMQEISVRAYVYDGTLTFGIRTNGDVVAACREARNSAGGDGWFKVDNFTIYKEGFIASDQAALYDYLLEALNVLAELPMDSRYAEKYGDVSSFDNADEAIAAIAKYIDEAKVQVEAYAQLKAAIDQANARLENCEENGYKGVKAFASVIEDTQDNYYDGLYTAEQVAEAISALEEAYQTCLHSGVNEGADVSDLIVNRSFEDLQNQGGNNSDGVVAAPYGWTLTINGTECQSADDIRAQGVTAWCAINSGDGINIEENGVVYNHQYTDGTHVWGIWNASIPQVELSQKLSGLDPGTYRLTADVMARNTDWSGHNQTTQRIFANDAICVYGVEDDYYPEALQGTSSDDIYRAYKLYEAGTLLDDAQGLEFYNFGGWDANDNDLLLRTLEVYFGVDESGEATIGFRTDGLDAILGEPRSEQAAGWFKLDNFTLYFVNSEVPNNLHVGIQSVAPAKRDTKAIFDLSGRKVSKVQKGIYIINGNKVVK